MLECFQVLFGLLQEILLQCPSLDSAVSLLQTFAASCASANSECAPGLPSVSHVPSTVYSYCAARHEDFCLKATVCRLPSYLHSAVSLKHAACHKDFHKQQMYDLLIASIHAHGIEHEVGRMS